MQARLARQWNQALTEFRNGKRFYPDLAIGSSRRRQVERKVEGARRDARGKVKVKTPVGSESSTEGMGVGSGGRVGRGKVRFEVGRSPEVGRGRGSGERGDGDGEGEVSEGVEGLLRRMWMGEGSGAGAGED